MITKTTMVLLIAISIAVTTVVTSIPTVQGEPNDGCRNKCVLNKILDKLGVTNTRLNSLVETENEIKNMTSNEISNGSVYNGDRWIVKFYSPSNDKCTWHDQLTDSILDGIECPDEFRSLSTAEKIIASKMYPPTYIG